MTGATGVGYERQARLPLLVPRSEIREDEIRAYDELVEFVEQLHGQYDPTIESGRHGIASPVVEYFEALSVAPKLSWARRVATTAVIPSQDTNGSFTGADHELIDLLLGFDSGYWCLHEKHTIDAAEAGVRLEALEALRDGRESDLTSDEKLLVDFIRAVRDGLMTDELWNAMATRLGSQRGVVEYAFLVCHLWTHHRLMWALGCSAMAPSDWDALIERLRTRASAAD